MKKFLKYLIYSVASLFGILLLLFIYIQIAWDKSYEDVEYPNLKASTDSAVIAHGEYLVRGPAHCSNCHVGNWDEAMRADAGEKLPLKGGVEFPIGPIAMMYSKNLTPDKETGIGRYTDAELFRFLRHNVRPNHLPSLAPLMPFANMADDDLVAIVSYLRSLKPVRNKVPEAEWTLMGKSIAALLRPDAFKPVLNLKHKKHAPKQEPTIERGEYLANYVANCKACHSPLDHATGELMGPAFSGSMVGEPSLDDPNVIIRSPNLTPDPTGVLLTYPTEESWIKRFRMGRLIKGSSMHWGPFSRMTDNDLKAIFLYLHSLKPVMNKVFPIVERVKG